MPGTYAVILADPAPQGEAVLGSIASVLEEMLGMVRYDAIRRARVLQGVLLEDLAGQQAQRIADRLNAVGVLAAVADGRRAPAMPTAQKVRALRVATEALHAQLGYHGETAIPWPRIHLISLCQFIEHKHVPKATSTRRRGLFGGLAGAGLISSAFKVGYAGALRQTARHRNALKSQTKDSACYVCHIHLRDPDEVLELRSDACGFLGLGDAAETHGVANFRKVLAVVEQAAPDLLFSPAALRFLDGQGVEESATDDLNEFRAYNRWLQLVTVAFTGSEASPLSETAVEGEPQPAAESEPGAESFSTAPSPVTPIPETQSPLPKTAPIPQQANAGRARPSTAAPQRPLAQAQAQAQARGNRSLPRKPGWSFLGWVVRWGMTTLGLCLIYAGVEHYLFYKPLDETARAVSVAEASDLVAGKEKHFISLSADLSDTAIYPTGLSRPQYTLHAPEEVASLNARRDYEKLLGANVEARSGLNPLVVVTIQTVREDEDGKTLQSERLLAPVLLDGYRVWAFSPPFWPGRPGKEAWLKRNLYAGRLCLLQDLNANRRGLRKTMDEFRQFVRNEWRIAIPPRSLIILTDREPARNAGPNGKVDCYVPVAGSESGLFLYARRNQLDRFRTGTIEGLLTPYASNRFNGIAFVLQQNLPERVGLITDETAAGYNRTEERLAGTALATGFFFFSLGALWIGIRLYLYLRAVKTVL